jgi:hypothetical protein
MDIEVNSWEVVEWITVLQNEDTWRVLVKTVMKHQIP